MKEIPRQNAGFFYVGIMPWIPCGPWLYTDARIGACTKALNRYGLMGCIPHISSLPLLPFHPLSGPIGQERPCGKELSEVPPHRSWRAG